MNNKIWKGEIKIKVMNYTEVTFIGRRPQVIEDDRHRNALIKLGTFTAVGDKMVKYVGRVRYKDVDGKNIEIDQDGKIDIDKDNLNVSSETLSAIEKEFE